MRSFLSLRQPGAKIDAAWRLATYNTHALGMPLRNLRLGFDYGQILFGRFNGLSPHIATEPGLLPITGRARTPQHCDAT